MVQRPGFYSNQVYPRGDRIFLGDKIVLLLSKSILKYQRNFIAHTKQGKLKNKVVLSPI